ncbi:MAG: RNA polymerase sigma factor [Anaerolineae bacterium]
MTGMAIDAPNRLEQTQTAVPAPVDIETLVHTYYDAVYRLALAILEEPADAEDAVQETFIAAARALSK